MNIAGFITATALTVTTGIFGLETVQPAVQDAAAVTQLSSSVTALTVATSTGVDDIRYKHGMLIVGDVTTPNITVYIAGAETTPEEHPANLGADWCAEVTSETGQSFHYTIYTQGVADGSCETAGDQ